jgi:hypothetical protein
MVIGEHKNIVTNKKIKYVYSKGVMSANCLIRGISSPVLAQGHHAPVVEAIRLEKQAGRAWIRFRIAADHESVVLGVVLDPRRNDRAESEIYQRR